MPVDRTDLERVFREERGRVVATLIRLCGDIDVAEEAVQEAFVVAVERWPDDRRAAQPRRLDPDHGPAPGHRPAAPRVHAATTARCTPCACTSPTTRSRRWGR